MKTWALLLEYDGTRYSGWQEQKNARTVMGELRAAADKFFGLPVDMQGAGRTDAGVHALGQVAHLRVATRRKAAPEDILRALNEDLPSDIAVLAVKEAPPRFHARHDALSRTYIYQFSKRKTAFSKRFVWWVKQPLEEERMARAAAMLVGRHDFACFRAPDPSRQEESTIVVVEQAHLEREEDGLVFRIEASHFLWRMVRRLAGTLVKIGARELGLADFARLLEGRPDSRFPIAAWTAPSSGLLLESVKYPRHLL